MKAEVDFFLSPKSTPQSHYEALRMFYVQEKTAQEVAEHFGYSVSTVYALTRDFKRLLRDNEEPAYKFFQRPQPGRRKK
ncbi:MAG: hypothetical protein WBM44_10835 [Waterburya sp.]